MTGIGIDILDLARVRRMRWLERAAEYVLCVDERADFLQHPDRVQFFASRLALKEAIIKACPAALTYHDMRIYKYGARPGVKFRPGGPAQRIHLSLSHTFEYVAAVAVIE